MTNDVDGRLEPCEQCGHLKTEYVGHGSRGRYDCWWCRDRAAALVPVKRHAN